MNPTSSNRRGAGLVCFAILAFAAFPAAADKAFIYVTNSAGDSIHVIDPATNKVVQVIKGIEAAHGIDFAPDGTRVYVSNEADSTLDVVDRASGKMLKKVPLSGHPNNIAVTKDGGRVVVGIAEEAGALDVVDTATLKVAKSIPVNGRLHNVYVTPDNKYAVTGSIRTKIITVIDLKTEAIAWELKLDEGVRPMARPSGSPASTPMPSTRIRFPAWSLWGTPRCPRSSSRGARRSVRCRTG